MHHKDDAQSFSDQKKSSKHGLLGPAVASTMIVSMVALMALIACGDDAGKKNRGDKGSTGTKTQTDTSGGGSQGAADAGKGDSSGKDGDGKGSNKDKGTGSDEEDDDDEGDSGSRGSGSRGSGSKSSGGFLKGKDFAEEKSPLTQKEVGQRLLFDLSSAVQTIDASKLNGDNSGSEDACSKSITKKVKISPKKLTLDEANISCKTDQATVEFKIKNTFTCEKNAFDKVTHDKLSSTTVLDRCAESKMTQFLNAQMKRESKDTITNVTEAMMTSSGQPCTLSLTKSTVTVEDGCIYYKMGSYKISGKTQKFSIKAQYKSVGGSIKKPLYTSGTLDVVINGWKGTIKLSGSDPSYTLTSAKGEKVSGKWSDLESK